MVTVNLLPWRQARLREQQQQFIRLLALSGALVMLAVFFAHLTLSGKVSAQQSRNALLQSEINKLDIKIREISTLEKEKQGLIERMQIVTKLESTRNDVVNLLSELVQALPNGVFLTTVVQSGSNIQLSGLAQSNARVSEFMRELDVSDNFANPRLSRIDAEQVGAVKGSKFSLRVNQKYER